jgi:hypothetical protein
MQRGVEKVQKKKRKKPLMNVLINGLHIIGAAGRNRTHDPLVRSLPVQFKSLVFNCLVSCGFHPFSPVLYSPALAIQPKSYQQQCGSNNLIKKLLSAALHGVQGGGGSNPLAPTN